MLTIAALMYADDLVLMSCDRDELELMLQVFDSVCSRMCMCVNAAKTELMAVCHHGEPPESVQLSGGEARYVPSLSAWVVWLTRLQAGRLRSPPALARLGAEMQRVWYPHPECQAVLPCLRVASAVVCSETWGAGGLALRQLQNEISILM
jgi:hypothetical protein